MTDPATAASPAGATGTTGTTAAGTTGAAGATGNAAAAAQLNNSSVITSMGDLKSKSPKIYKAILEGIGTNICNKMKQDQDKLKEIREEYEH